MSTFDDNLIESDIATRWEDDINIPCGPSNSTLELEFDPLCP